MLRIATRTLVVVTAALFISGCDKVNALIDTKSSDAKAVGYACRMAQKLPNVCMAENPKQPQSYILEGWQKADEEIKDGVADPKMMDQAPGDEEHMDKDMTKKEETE